MLKINIFLPLAIEKADGAENDCKLCKAAFLTNLPLFIVSKFKNDHGSFLDHWLLQCEACKSLPKMNNYFASLKGSRVEAPYLPVLMQPQFVTVRASPPQQMDHRQTCNKLKNKLTTCNMLHELANKGEIATTFITIISSLASLQIHRVAVFELITVTRVIKGLLWIV